MTWLSANAGTIVVLLILVVAALSAYIFMIFLHDNLLIVLYISCFLTDWCDYKSIYPPCQ